MKSTKGPLRRTLHYSLHFCPLELGFVPLWETASCQQMQQAALVLPRFEAPSPGGTGVISGVRCQGSSKRQVDFVRSLAAPLKFSEINLVTAAEVITTWHGKPLARSSKTIQEEMPFSDPSGCSCHSGLGKSKKMTLLTLDYAFYFSASPL